MKTLIFVFAVILLSIPVPAAPEEGDAQIKGMEVEKLLNFGSGLLAAGLFAFSLFAYKRSGKSRLMFVSLAFFLFSAKMLLMAHELFFDEWSWVDTVSSTFDFAILLCFFLGILKK